MRRAEYNAMKLPFLAYLFARFELIKKVHNAAAAADDCAIAAAVVQWNVCSH